MILKEKESFHGKIKSIHILGCSIQLCAFSKINLFRNSIVIALNSSWLYCQQNNIPVEYHFFACKRFVSRYRHSIEYQHHPKKIITYKDWELLNKKTLFYSPSKVINIDPRENLLKAGFSVAVPAYNFACLLEPENIFFHGFDLQLNTHWNGEGDDKTFPAKGHVITQINEIKNTFCFHRTFCSNPDCALVESGVMEYSPLQQSKIFA